MPASKETILVAPNAFKGTLSAASVAGAIAAGVQAAQLKAEIQPLADGGDGTLEVLELAYPGQRITTRAQNAIGTDIDVEVTVTDRSVALIESALVCGGAALEGEKAKAYEASSYGVGQVLAAACSKGVKKIVLGVGGTVTSDGGAGALQALKDLKVELPQTTLLCDVQTAWEDAPAIFAPQKGASAQTVRQIEDRLANMATQLPKDPRGKLMTGAGGGLAGGLWAVHGVTLKPGTQTILNLFNIRKRLQTTRALITGEGCLDQQTLYGKVVADVARFARQAGTPVHAIVGKDRMTNFDKRILDLQFVGEASTEREITAVTQELAERLRTGEL